MAKTPGEQKAAKAEYAREYRETHRKEAAAHREANREKEKAYRDRPEIKAKKIAYDAEYRELPETKARIAERLLKPEVRAENRERQHRRRESAEERLKDVARVAARRKSHVRKLNLLKMDRPCYDCGGTFPLECMDWDHLPGKEKLFTVSEGKSKSIESVVDEINKCQLVCANCHRVRTCSRPKA